MLSLISGERAIVFKDGNFGNQVFFHMAKSLGVVRMLMVMTHGLI